jgi:hypothetical protein
LEWFRRQGRAQEDIFIGRDGLDGAGDFSLDPERDFVGANCATDDQSAGDCEWDERRDGHHFIFLG